MDGQPCKGSDRMTDEQNLDRIKAQIKRARQVGREVHKSRAMLAGVMAGAPGIVGTEVMFPEPDIMHAYQCMFGRRVGEPTTYRLSFGKQLKWVGVSHPWGLKPADIIVEEEVTA